MKSLLSLLSLFAVLLLASCGEEKAPTEYDNWPSRNAAAFADTLKVAEAAIAQARQLHGEDWKQHCDWRIFSSHLLAPGAAATTEQKIVVRRIEQGQGSGTPLYTDTVRVNYIGRLMPTLENPQGRVFDHSGKSNQFAQVFHPHYDYPSKHGVSQVVEGFSTALQQMHIGDLWRVFIPSAMGYRNATLEAIPPHSMLIFDLQLKAYWRAGVKP